MSLSWGTSVQNFQSSVKKSAKEMDRLVGKVVEKTAEEIFRQAEKDTPVRTGRLKKGWRISQKFTRKGTTALIKNEVPYAGFVENGTIKMAPRRMLKRALIRGRRNIRRRLKAAKRRNAMRFNRGS